MLKKIIAFSTVVLCANALSADAPTSKEELLNQFIEAHSAKNYDEISKLINWDDVGRYKQKIVRTYTKANFGRKVVDSEFQEADTDFLKKFSVGSKKYKSNMEVSHLMRLYFDDTTKSDDSTYDSVVYLVGKNDGGYKISIAVADGDDKTASGH